MFVKSNEQKTVRVGNKVTKLNTVVPSYQSNVISNLGTRSTQTVDSVPTNLFRNSGGKFRTILRKGSFPKIRSCVLKISVAESGGSNSVKVCPAPYLFDRIRIIADAGSGNCIFEQTADTLLMNNVMLASQTVWRQISENLNMDPESWFESTDIIEASGARNYYLPLTGSWLDQQGVYWKNAEADLQIEFSPTSSALISGSGTLDCTGLSFIFESEQDDEKTEYAIEKQLSGSVHSFGYLEPIRVDYLSKTITASTECKLSLENVRGEIAFLLVMLRATSASNSDNGYMKYLPLGFQGTVDVVNNSGSSVFGQGQPVPGVYFLQQEWSRHIPNNFSSNRAVYMVPFCKNVQAALKGVKQGYLDTKNEVFHLSLVPGAAGTSTVQTLNCNNAANDGGYYKLMVEGFSTKSLAHNTSAANCKAAVDPLYPMRHGAYGPILSSFSGTLETDATVTITPAQNLKGKKLIQVISESLNDGGVAEFVETTESTRGKQGWTTGSYDVTIYAYVHKHLYHYGGRLSAEQD